MGCAAAALLPKQARGNLRKHLTKPFSQPDALDCIVWPHEPVYIAVRAAHNRFVTLVFTVAVLGAIRLVLDDGEVGAGAHMGELHPGGARGFPVSG